MDENLITKGVATAGIIRAHTRMETPSLVLNGVTHTTLSADTVNSLTYAATVTPDPDDGLWVTLTLTGNVTIDLSSMVAGQTLVFDISQDGVGSHTVGFTQTLEWPGGTALTHTGTASSRDRIVVDYDGTTYTGHVVGQDYS